MRKLKEKVRIGAPPKFRIVGVEREFKAMHQTLSLADKTYFKELHEIIDKVFNRAAEDNQWTWSQLAGNAGLSYETVARLGDRATKWPRFSTVWRLCHAVGWELSLTAAPKQTAHLQLRKIA